MNLQSLTYFAKVAEIKHYTKAADSLHITQSALSKAIRSLERELDAPLFLRDGRRVELTEYGKTFYRYIKPSVDDIEKGISAVRRMARQNNNIISVSALYSMYAEFLPRRIQRFREENRACAFELEYKITSEILQDLIGEKVDLGVCSNYDPKDSGYESIQSHMIGSEELILIVPPKHPLAQRPMIKWADLNGEDVIAYKRSNNGLNHTVNENCRKEGFEINIVAEAKNDYALVGLVSAGEGVAVISEKTPMNLDNVIQKRFDSKSKPVRNIYVAWKKDKKLPLFAEMFRDFLIKNPM